MSKWKIWYDDGTTYSSDDGLPEDAPVDGVQAILQWLPYDNYDIIPPNDYFWWLEDRWVSGSVSGLERCLRKRSQVILLFGRWAGSKLYYKILDDVRKAADGGN